MPWIFFAVISVLFISVANLFSRVLMKDKKGDAIAYTIAFQILCGVLTGVFALYKGFVMPPVQEYFWNFILGGILYGFASICMFEAVKFLEASDAAILSAASTVITIVASIIFLHESFSMNKVIGTILILVAVFIIDRSKKLRLNKGTIFVIGSTVLASIAVTNDAYILRSSDAVSYTPIAFLFPAVFIVLFFPKAITKFHTLVSKNNLRNMFLLGLFYSVQAVTYYLALERGAGASQMGPIYKANIIVTLILAALFLRERDHLGIKFVSAILVTVGVLLLM